jgi:hypothetical protein
VRSLGTKAVVVLCILLNEIYCAVISFRCVYHMCMLHLQRVSCGLSARKPLLCCVFCCPATPTPSFIERAPSFYIELTLSSCVCFCLCMHALHMCGCMPLNLTLLPGIACTHFCSRLRQSRARARVCVYGQKRSTREVRFWATPRI